ncbi:toll-like receptor 3 [Bradysia coprophila]|uniref:toll-like receptor 3 n=1 Tax=Bradysia coprophila TaxID=38358 RepID=UPI00187D9188|nr:toll-like receptor 3 [Bradysia coprophila]
MSTELSRKCVKLVYGLLVLLLVSKFVESWRKTTSPPYRVPAPTTAAHRYPPPTTKPTTKKPKSVSSDSDELLTIVEDQSKQAPIEVHPSNHDPCVLGSADLYLSWWIYENGSLSLPEDMAEMTLDFSGFVALNSTALADEIRYIQDTQLLGEPDIVFMSIANSNLTEIPKDALGLLQETLQYLSLSGNDFSDDEERPETNLVFNSPTLFNRMDALRELDMRKCNIHHLQDDAFRELINLEKLFLSHNYIDQIETTVFSTIPNLIHLDLSHNNVDENTLTRGALTKTFEGIKFDNDFQFSHLKGLLFLDLSHSKVSILSTPSFTAMPSSLRMLSLCYTTISHIPEGMFKDSNLQVLDLSGNPSLAYYSQGGSLSNLSHSLQVLSMEDSMIKKLGLICKLKNLKILQLEGNNINQINRNTFDGLEHLEMLDLSSNHLSNWYSRVFENNPNLRLLKLRNNNINLITSAMYDDFSSLKYLALGNNDFICNCEMREFIDRAIENSHRVNSSHIESEMPTVADTLSDIVASGYEAMLNKNLTFSYNIRQRILYDYLATIDTSYENILKTKKKNVKYNLQVYKPKPAGNPKIIKRSTDDEETPTDVENEVDDDDLDFTFQLLDFFEDNYKCINSSSNKYHNLSEIDECIESRSLGIGDIQSISNKLIIIISVFVFILISFLVIYYKWWYVRYFFVIIKNAAILSYLGKEKIVQVSREEEEDEAFTYDVFVSYCEQNRDWIIDEFLPNVEHHRDIRVCLHERDFQVGLSILENIISCMDRSRCLLLVVSQSFLLSQWCQFEMHLAQHRLLETHRDQLILVLLEDIPTRKRPKTLHYLMKTKTYIKWPQSESTTDNHGFRVDKEGLHIEEEKKMFWRRLTRALVPYDYDESRS